MTQWVYTFGNGSAEGRADMKDLLGGKGANLAEMSNLGLPVPPGFTITTEVCTYYYAHGETYPAELKAAVEAALEKIAGGTGARLGDPENPLLVSVRSGARVSMPGMMDTVLNLGLTETTVAGLARLTGDPRFAYDSYRRFIQMYSNVVLGVEHALFEEILESEKEDKGLELDTELAAEDLRHIADLYKAQVLKELGQPFPDDVHAQLWGAIGAVFGSWKSPRAKTYRRLHHIPEEWGTAVNVQAMVFGNRGETSATGVAFTRDPSTGEKVLYGEFLVNAQGEDVVAGIRTPQPISRLVRERQGGKRPSMEEVDAGGPCRAVAHRGHARSPLPRHAGRGIHDPGGHALHAADPHRKARGRGRPQDRRRHGGRGPDRPDDRGRPGRSGGARPAAASRRWIPTRPRPRSRSGWRPRRARPRARWPSPPTRPKSWPARAGR